MAGPGRKGDDLFGIAKAFQARHVGWNVHDRIITNPHRTNNLAMPFPEYLIRVFRKGLQASERSHGEPPGPNGPACQRQVGCHRVPLPVFGNHESFPAGTACGCHTPHYPTSAWLFFCISFRFGFPPPTTDCYHCGKYFRRAIRNEMPSRPKRNAPLKRAGKPQEGSRPNSRDAGGEKTSGGPAWPAAKKPSRDGTRSGPARIPETGRLPPDVPVP